MISFNDRFLESMRRCVPTPLNGFRLPTRHLFQLFWLGLLISQSALSQPVDPSIGRNIPGAVPRTAPDAFVPERSAIEEEPEVPKIPIIGSPGQGVLRKIVFSGGLNVQDRREGTALRPGVFSDRVDLLERSQLFAFKLEEEYLGKPFTAETVQQITQQALEFYYKKERPLVFIQPSAINFETGELRFIVIEARLDAKKSVGARWFSNRFLLSNLRVRSGQYINRMCLLNDLSWINENPFLQSRVVVKPGSQPGTTTLVLETKDRIPVRVFAALDNTGSQQTGPWRWTFGANWGNAFSLGHQLNYQFSAAFEDLTSQPVHAISYLAPLPWHHRLAIFASYAGTDTDIDAGSGQSISYNGYQAQLSPRYSIPIGKLYGNLTQELSLGMDWKGSDLAFIQGGESIPSNKTNVCQFMAGYNVTLADPLGRTTLGGEVYVSPGGIGGLNSDEAFQSVDPRLQANYVYGVLRLGRMTKLPRDFSLVMQFTGQLASAPLISSEQLAIGGYGTVRGYDERVLFGDQGFVFNLEFRTPPISLASHLSAQLPADELQFLLFWDIGLVNSIEPLPGDPASSYLTSLGFGVRYRIGTNLSVRCDVGFPLVNPDLGFPVDTARASVGATLGF